MSRNLKFGLNQNWLKAGQKSLMDRTTPKQIQEVVLGEQDICIDDLVAVARYHAKVSFSDTYYKRVRHSRELIKRFLEENRLIYGVTTGFGSNVSKLITPEDAHTLQKNIIYSHAVSVGQPLDREIVRATQFMILLTLGQGYSGIRIEVLETIASLLNHDIVPFAPGDGSVGYLAPEAHMALVLLGEGKAWYQDQLISGEDALTKAGIRPIELTCKEGLALITGTTSVTAIAALAQYNASQAVQTADIVGAMSFQALKGTVAAFDPRLHSLKRHVEQAQTAELLMRVLEGSEIADTYKMYRLQDALSLRCIPQVHGAVKHVLNEAAYSITNEINSVSDNPVIYPFGEDGVALMGGNFDGTYVGIAADSMCIAMANLAKLAERRIDRLVNHHVSELPDFLVMSPGLNSGYMIPQYTAAGLVVEIQTLCQPSTIHTIPTCANQEDVVSYAYHAARKAYAISSKLEHVLAIELMAACQAIDFHTPLQPSPATGAVYNLIRKQVPTLDEDRLLYPDMEYIQTMIHTGAVTEVVNQALKEQCS